MPAGPTQWELELYRLGLTEQEVMGKLGLVEKWVRCNVGNCFIPTAVLEALHLNEF
jgi:hypothetical protein